ncbi:sufE-like protein 2, chloroplastic [Rutidosis leptorrhynchoides]|uniref:sufE-like protein 2, chloroplastic n=1 Tax=Rutidosis leptorrhynchoides TaxID=125765 RepID=UPI003A9A0D50
MNSTTANSTVASVFKPPQSHSIPPLNSSNRSPTHIQFKPDHSNLRAISTTSLQTPHPITPPQPPYFPANLTVSEKLQILISEFKSLPEPIDRVKRLLHYANLLPPFDESRKIESNRVTGCTAQVWLDVMMDDNGKMRFIVDSDSEITKGFCYCLIWLLDGGSAIEVIEIRVDDLREMNVGILPIRASSRVNTWHNVLISMQRRTRDLILQ